LADKEMSRLQESVEAAQKVVQEEELQKEKEVVAERVAKLKRELLKETNLLSEINNRIYYLRFGGSSDSGGPKKQFMMPCPADGCRGFLSTQWKCELCGLYTCKECFEILGDRKTDEHTCTPDNLASAELIRKETKPCPTCGCRIYKIDGCDQMWCTQCKVAFSWRTGAICTSSSIHNPHYLEWQRNTQGSEPMRAVGDVPCGGLITYYQCDRISYKVAGLRSLIVPEYVKGSRFKSTISLSERVVADIGFHPLAITRAFNDVYRVANDIVNSSVPAYRRSVTELQDYTSIRVQYMLKRIDKEEFGRRVYMQDIKRQKTQQILHILELLSAVLCETFNEVLRYASQDFVGLSKTNPAVIENYPFQPSSCVHPKDAKDIIIREYKRDAPNCAISRMVSNMDSEANLNVAYTMMGAMERLHALFEYSNSEFAIISSSFSASTPYIDSSKLFPYLNGLELNSKGPPRAALFERSHRFKARDRKIVCKGENPQENVKIKNT